MLYDNNFKNYDNICFNSFYLFYQQNINGIMTKLGSTKCYSINNLNRSLKIFPEFFLSAMISEKFP